MTLSWIFTFTVTLAHCSVPPKYYKLLDHHFELKRRYHDDFYNFKVFHGHWIDYKQSCKACHQIDGLLLQCLDYLFQFGAFECHLTLKISWLLTIQIVNGSISKVKAIHFVANKIHFYHFKSFKHHHSLYWD